MHHYSPSVVAHFLSNGVSVLLFNYNGYGLRQSHMTTLGVG